MKVLINGIGNIGTTIINLILDHKELLSIDEVYGLKNTSVNDWNRNELNILQSKGLILCAKSGKNGFLNIDTIINEIDYIFDCNTNGIGFKNKDWYNSLPNLIGASAQGSEKNFGVSFMSDINNEKLVNEKFAHIVSCNTHSLSAIIDTVSLGKTDQILDADFVVVRRSEDIGNHERLVSANVVSRHMNNTVGTHHAIDVKDLFQTIDQTFPVQSSDITTPSQLMHTVRFNIQLKDKINLKLIENRVKENPYLATTNKFDSNIVFEFGRKYSPYGRLYSHAIINFNNFLFDEDANRLKGWSFIPQEGNTILSTIHAFLLQTNSAKVKAQMDDLKKHFLHKEW